MKTHPCGPQHVAAQLDPDLQPQDALDDIREHPDLYYPDHLQMSEQSQTLPLSEQAWRRACLAA